MATQDKDILYYEKTGQGPVIVLLHGYMTAGQYWDNIRIRLEESHTVITVDLLGFGSSPKPRNSNYDYEDHLPWIDRTLKQAGVTIPAVMAGHSMGTLLALRYALLHPDKVSRLALFNMPLFEGREQARHELAGTNLFFRMAIYWRMHRVFVPVLRTKTMKTLVRHFADAKYRGMEKYGLTSTGISRGRSLRNIIEGQKAIEDLKYISVPTTIVAGLAERRAYLENIEKLQKRENIHVIFTDSTHHTPLEDPNLIVDVLQQK